MKSAQPERHCRCGDAVSAHKDGAGKCSILNCGCVAFVELKPWSWDGRDAQIARKRMVEIDADPTQLVRGEELSALIDEMT